VARFAELDGALRERIQSRTCGDWEPLLAGHRVPFSPVLRPATAATSEHVRHRGLLARVGGFTTMRQPLLAPGLERTPVGRVPAVGEHTAEVLVEAGLTEAEVDKVLARAAAVAGRDG
jgi:crotonobetainyl-CoA:carnitine CoA-transferase CaiB-like acyl-CoA transferase